MANRPIAAAGGPLEARLSAPASKSVTHRALVAAALACGPSRLGRPLIADDTLATREGLRALGFEIDGDGDAWTVHGRGGEVPGGGHLELGESGTTCRLLTAVAALGARPSRLDGAPRLRERPVSELAAALGELGAMVHVDGPAGGLPLVAGGRPPRGGAVEIPGQRSSQFASALLLIGGRLPHGLELTVAPPAVSLPYIEITARVLEAFGVPVERAGPRQWTVRPANSTGRTYRIEGDHSSASYFLAAAAVVGGRVRVDDLDPASAQPDARLAGLLERLGCEVRRGEDWIEVTGTGRVPGFDEDLGEAPDLAPTVAVLALFADGPCRLTGVAHLRLKESDRLEMLARNLDALGRPARAAGDSLEVAGPPSVPLHGGPVATAADHRLAMAFAVAGLRLAGVTIDDPACVAKSNPDFWKAFDRLRGGAPA